MMNYELFYFKVKCADVSYWKKDEPIGLKVNTIKKK